MMQSDAAVDSKTVGDPVRFRPLAELERMLRDRPPAPADHGRLALVVSRGAGGRRQALPKAVLTSEDGVPGDAWGRTSRKDRDAQLAVMQLDVAELFANGQPLTLFGDNLFLDLDLSSDNLPTGSRVRVGGAVLEVTPKPHTGCRKFRARFGDDALALQAKPELKRRNLRGIYLRVVEAGEVRVDDPAEVVARPTRTAGPT
jgi:MOSC domain-containing protein YiiM